MELEVRYNLNLQSNGFWLLQMFVTQCSDDGDPNVFVHQKVCPEVYEESTEDYKFTNIASYADMNDYPISEPNDDTNFFRLKQMQISIEDPEVVLNTIATVKEHLFILTNSIKELS